MLIFSGVLVSFHKSKALPEVFEGLSSVEVPKIWSVRWHYFRKSIANNRNRFSPVKACPQRQAMTKTTPPPPHSDVKLSRTWKPEM